MLTYLEEVITEYVFGRSVAVLDKPDLGYEYAHLGREANKIHAVARAFPAIMRRFFQLPGWMMAGNEMFQVVQRLNNEVYACTEQAFDEAVQQKDKSTVNVMKDIVESSSLPPEEKTLVRLKNEGIIFVLAGMETSAKTLAVTFYHILANPDVQKRLQEELRAVIPSSSSSIPPISALEKLPYLTAVINEGHRMANGVAGRLARVAAGEDLVCQGYTIPRGATMSQSNYLLHTDPEAFPNPHEYHPERFLASEGYANVEAVEAQKHLVPFSRGARMCVGQNLAWAELYLTIAVLMTSVRMELVDTTARDVTIESEHFVGLLPEDSKGIRVRVLGKA